MLEVHLTRESRRNRWAERQYMVAVLRMRWMGTNIEDEVKKLGLES